MHQDLHSAAVHGLPLELVAMFFITNAWHSGMHTRILGSVSHFIWTVDFGTIDKGPLGIVADDAGCSANAAVASTAATPRNIFMLITPAGRARNPHPAECYRSCRGQELVEVECVCCFGLLSFIPI
jgi:hypothetical protein